MVLQARRTADRSLYSAYSTTDSHGFLVRHTPTIYALLINIVYMIGYHANLQDSWVVKSHHDFSLVDEFILLCWLCSQLCQFDRDFG